MSGIPFHNTQMGHRFIEATVPALAEELSRLNRNLERLLVVLERLAMARDSKPGEPQ